MFYVNEDDVQLKNVCYMPKTKDLTLEKESIIVGKLILKSDQLQFYSDCDDEESNIVIFFSEIHRCLLSQKNTDYSICDSNFKIEITHSNNLYFKIFSKTFQIFDFLMMDTHLNKHSKKAVYRFFKDLLKKTFYKSDDTLSKLPNTSILTKDMLSKRKVYTHSFFKRWMKSTTAKGSSLCDLNLNYNEPFLAFPAFFLVPQGWYGSDVKNFSQIVDDYRGPVFCFSYPATRNMLLRSASFIKYSDSAVQFQKLKACIIKHTNSSEVQMYDLDELLPSLLEVKESFETLHKICLPESQSSFNEIDSHWLMKLEQCRWLEIIHQVLETVKIITTKIKSDSYDGGVSVMIMEYKGRDWTCLISSIVQILLFPELRMLRGFQDLIEKEWILMGHDFTERNGLRIEKSNQAHLFTLFLDCVWQLINQFPLEFEFSEAYLLKLSDASYRPTFIEFGCGAEFERCFYIMSKHSVWDWLSSKSTNSDFKNPYFLFGRQHLSYEPISEPLPISATIWCLKFWKSYYFRGNNYMDTGITKELEDFMGNDEFYQQIDNTTTKSASSTFYVPNDS